ncbi:MAG TPA: hypothetical protein VMM92_07210 [Thermoanaerobaculia bacterium]|nr:hypothetical protein [Thermoanaerobaculia bacterium]
MKRALLPPLLAGLAGLALLAACNKGVTSADKAAFAQLDANQPSCDALVGGIVTAYQQATAAGTPPADAVHRYLLGAGAAPAAEMQAGLPFAEKAVRPASAEEGEMRNLLVDWQERQAHLCAFGANFNADDLKNFIAEHDRVEKAIHEARSKLIGMIPLSPTEKAEIVRDRGQTVHAAVRDRLGELAAQSQLQQQHAAQAAAEEAEARQLVAEDQAREDEKRRLKAQEEEDKEALNAERRTAEELEIRMKRERQERTMRERQIQGAAQQSRALVAWAGTYRQQIEPFARLVRTAERSAASDPSVCQSLRHAGDSVHIPQAPDPNLQGHLAEALRLVGAAAESCGQKLKDTTAFRLQLVDEHLAAIERELPSH